LEDGPPLATLYAGLPDAGPRDFPAAQAATSDLCLAERPRLGQLRERGVTAVCEGRSHSPSGARWDGVTRAV